MNQSDQHSPDLLCAEIVAEAQRERDEILRRAQTEAAAILATAQAEVERIRRERLAHAQAEATRRKELILATVAVETGRLRSARVENLLAEIHAELRRRLLEPNFPARELVLALASEAICGMPATHFVVKISAADQAAFGSGLESEITRRTGRLALHLVIAADGALTGGDVMIQDAAGLLFWDNRLLSRLDRLWPELRRQIAVQTSLVSENDPIGGAP